MLIHRLSILRRTAESFAFSLTLVALAVTSPISLKAQARFAGLGTPNAFPKGISADGTIIVGVRSNIGPAFRWTAADGS